MAHQNPKGPLIESDEVVVRFLLAVLASEQRPAFTNTVRKASGARHLDETYGARRCVDMMGV